MSADTIAAVQRAYEGFARGDLTTMFEVLDPNVEWNAEEAWAHRGIYHGHEGVVRYIGSLGDDWNDIRIEAKEFTDSVAGHAMVSGRILGIEASTGDPVEAPFVHVLRLSGGKVVRIQVFVDRKQAVEALRADTAVSG